MKKKKKKKKKIQFYCKQWNHCISEINIKWYFHMWKNMIFSLVKNNMVMFFSLFVSDYLGCLHCYPNRCRSHFDFFNSSDFSVSERNYQLLCNHFLNQNVRNISVTRLLWFAEIFCFCRTSTLHVKDWLTTPWRSCLVWWRHLWSQKRALACK